MAEAVAHTSREQSLSVRATGEERIGRAAGIVNRTKPPADARQSDARTHGKGRAPQQAQGPIAAYSRHDEPDGAEAGYDDHALQFAGGGEAEHEPSEGAPDPVRLAQSAQQQNDAECQVSRQAQVGHLHPSHPAEDGRGGHQQPGDRSQTGGRQ